MWHSKYHSVLKVCNFCNICLPPEWKYVALLLTSNKLSFKKVVKNAECVRKDKNRFKKKNICKTGETPDALTHNYITSGNCSVLVNEHQYLSSDYSFFHK